MRPEYVELKENFMKGWHTWNVRSVLSHVHMPDGLAINLAFKEYQVGNYLKETLIGRFQPEGRIDPTIESVAPGTRTFDGRYTELTMNWMEMEFHVESATEGEDLFLLVTPVKQQILPAMLVVETGYLWNRPGYTQKTEDTITACSADRTTTIRSTGTETFDPNIPVQSACLMITLDQPTAVYTGKKRTLAEIQTIIETARTETLQKSEQYGELAELCRAVECAIGWDTNYDPKNDRVVSPVSRLWSIGAGGYVLFCWDTFFAGYMASLGSKELAYSNLIEILNERTDNGFVPNFAYATGQKSADRSQPPVGSAMLLATYRKYHEKWIVEDMYPALLEWNSWWVKNRMNPSGALCWGSDPIPVIHGNYWEIHGVHERFGAALESGLDNSPMYDDIPFDEDTNRLKLEDVGLTGLYIMDCRALIALAKEIGRTEDLPLLEARLQKAEKGLEGLWDEENGFYYNRRTDTGEFSRRISPTNFYALYSTSIPEERLRRIADEHYYNPEEFYGEWMLPSIARNDAAYQGDYWRGRVWAPMNFLAYMALCQTSLSDVRKDLTEKSIHLFMKEWTEHRHIHENYNSITGEGCDVRNSDKFYHWGALLAVIALAESGIMPEAAMPLGENLK